MAIMRRGAGYVIKAGKVLLRGPGRAIANGVKRLKNLGARLLAKTRFNGFRIRITGRRFVLEGKINPWVVLASGELKYTASSTGAANWKSVKKFGHTFNTHGAGTKNTRRLIDRARTTGKPQGQWLDNQKAADFLNEFPVNGPAHVKIPDGLGQVINPDGSIVKALWARVVPNADGIRTAFPIIP
jgi:hypothetical protein